MRPNPEDGLWEMYQWNDFRLEDAPDSVEGTWGLLKGETRATT
jgi:hypothetical protein